MYSSMYSFIVPAFSGPELSCCSLRVGGKSKRLQTKLEAVRQKVLSLSREICERFHATGAESIPRPVVIELNKLVEQMNSGTEEEQVIFSTNITFLISVALYN